MTLECYLYFSKVRCDLPGCINRSCAEQVSKQIYWQAVVTRKDREALTAHIETIGSRLPLAEFYKTVFPTNAESRCGSDIHPHNETFG